MPHCDGVEATRRLRDHDASIKVLVLTTYTDDRSVIDALRAGARGYLTKDASAGEIRFAKRSTGSPAARPPSTPRSSSTWSTPSRRPSHRSHTATTRGAHAARSRSTRTDRPGTVEHRDRRPAGGQRDHSKKPCQSSLRQDRRPRPSPSRHLRLPARAHLNHRRNVPGPPCKGQAAGRGKTLPQQLEPPAKPNSKRSQYVDQLAASAAAKPPNRLICARHSPPAPTMRNAPNRRSLEPVWMKPRWEVDFASWTCR